MFDTIVEVKVGPELDHSFFLHKGVVTFYSGHFHGALNGNTVEAGKGAVELPTEDAATFKRSVKWIYTRRFETGTLNSAKVFAAICSLWVFADRRQVPMLANAMIDKLRNRVVDRWEVPATQLCFIYENTTANAGLRRFAVPVITRACKSDIVRKRTSRSDWPEDALWDVLGILWELRDKNDTKLMDKDEVAALDMCQYHTHEDGVRCSKGGKAGGTVGKGV